MALRNGDLEGCAQYLDSVGKSADIVSLWQQLAEQALNNNDVQVQKYIELYLSVRKISYVKLYIC